MTTRALYNEIKQQLNSEWMPTLEEECLMVSAKTIENKQVWSEITKFAPTQGWIQTLDRVNAVETFNPAQEQEAILSAEMINAKRQTLHIRPASNGNVILTTYSSEGEIFFYTETSHQIQLKKQTGRVHYRLYWPQSNPTSLENKAQPARQAQFSRFIGFDLKEGH